MTPYHYVMNNPLRFIDPTGLKEEEPEVDYHIDLDEVTVTAPAPTNNVSWLWQFFNYSQAGGVHFSDPNGNPNYNNPYTARHTEFMPNALRLFNLGFGRARGVNRSSRFNDGISKGIGKASEIGVTPDSEIKRSSTGKGEELDKDGRRANIEKAKEREANDTRKNTESERRLMWRPDSIDVTYLPHQRGARIPVQINDKTGDTLRVYRHSQRDVEYLLND